MEIIRVKRETDYTVVSNVYLKDPNLSLRAKGLFTLVLSFPVGWQLSVNGLLAITTEGRDAVKNTIKELIEKGYCSIAKVRGESGKFSENEYTFFESPFTEKPSTVKPSTVKRTQLNTDLIKDLSNNKYKEKIEKFSLQLKGDEIMDGLKLQYSSYKIDKSLSEVKEYHSSLKTKNLTYDKFKEHFYNKLTSTKEKPTKEKFSSGSTFNQSEL
jgi:hypothetical protein